MTIELAEVFGSPHIGVYAYANDVAAFLPRDAPAKVLKLVEETLEVPVIRVSIARSRLLGVLMAGNDSSLILPPIVYEEEVKELQEGVGDVKIVVLEGVKETTPGNLVLANDNACIVSSILPEKAAETISRALGVPCKRGNLGGFPLVGSVAVATNRALLLPPTLSEEEVEELSDFFGVKADVVTVNKGRIFLRSGIVANSKGALVGSETTGYELMKLQQLFP